MASLLNHAPNDGFAIKRNLFSPEHEQFRQTVQRFIADEITPHHAAWEEAGVVPREIWRKAGAVGMLCPNVPEAYGGMGAPPLSPPSAFWGVNFVGGIMAGG